MSTLEERAAEIGAAMELSGEPGEPVEARSLTPALLQRFTETARQLDAAQKALRAAQLAHAESIKLLSEEAAK